MDTEVSLNLSGPTLPEEILEQIVSYSLLSGFIGNESSSETSAFSLPLVSWAFNRIAKPLLYRYLHLRTRDQSEKLAEVLFDQPALCAYIRAIRVDVPSASRAFLVAAEILSSSPKASHHVLDALDVGLVCETDLSSGGSLNRSPAKEDVVRLNSALSVCPDTKCLVVRQDSSVRWNASVPFCHALASCVDRWQHLEMVDLQMLPLPVPSASGRRDPFAAALAKTPNLKVFRARQPVLLNNFLLDVAENTSLKQIHLVNTAVGLCDQGAAASPFFLVPFMDLERRRYHDADCATASPSKRFGGSETAYKHLTGGSGPVPKVVEVAEAELEAQIATEPQTLFASQVVAHPRLYELIRAGRLELIRDRFLKSRKSRYLGGDSKEESKSKCKLEEHPCTYHAIEKGVSHSACNGCPSRQAGTGQGK